MSSPQMINMFGLLLTSLPFAVEARSAATGHGPLGLRFDSRRTQASPRSCQRHESGRPGLHSLEEFGDAVCGVVADQPHPLGAVDAAFRPFVGVPILEACAGHWVDSASTSERDHDVDVTNELRINECG